LLCITVNCSETILALIIGSAIRARLSRRDEENQERKGVSKYNKICITSSLLIIFDVFTVYVCTRSLKTLNVYARVYDNLSMYLHVFFFHVYKVVKNIKCLQARLPLNHVLPRSCTESLSLFRIESSYLNTH
jgi:hypothetical protein